MGWQHLDCGAVCHNGLGSTKSLSGLEQVTVTTWTCATYYGVGPDWIRLRKAAATAGGKT